MKRQVMAVFTQSTQKKPAKKATSINFDGCRKSDNANESLNQAFVPRSHPSDVYAHAHLE